MPHRVKVQTDSIPYAVHDTIAVDSLVEVEVEVEVEIKAGAPHPRRSYCSLEEETTCNAMRFIVC